MFPLDSSNMDKYIFDEAFQTWENYLSNIKICKFIIKIINFYFDTKRHRLKK